MRTRTDRRKNVKTRGEFRPGFEPLTDGQLAARASARGAERKSLAATASKAYPNHAGNYAGKRTPAKEPRVLTPADRFNRLAGEFEMRARDYRWKRTATA